MTPVEGWTCFHCGKHFAGTFKGWQEALCHFGDNAQGDAWCQYTAKQVRAMEDLLRSYQQEDTPRDRYLHKIQDEHAVALRRAEEEGYAKGLDALSVKHQKLRATLQVVVATHAASPKARIPADLAIAINAARATLEKTP